MFVAFVQYSVLVMHSAHTQRCVDVTSFGSDMDSTFWSMWVVKTVRKLHPVNLCRKRPVK